MDKQFRLFGKISLIDVILVVLLAVFIVLAAKFSAPQSAAAKPGDKRITYVLEISKKPAEFLDKVKIGADLYDSVKGYYVGKIVDAVLAPYVEDSPDVAGQRMRRQPIEGLYYVYITVEADAQVTEKTTLVGQYEILVGRDMYMKNKDFAAGAYIVKLEGVRD